MTAWYWRWSPGYLTMLALEAFVSTPSHELAVIGMRIAGTTVSVAIPRRMSMRGKIWETSTAIILEGVSNE